MLGPLTREPRRLRILTYDLEWYPKTLVLRLVGVKDGKGYREYYSVKSFLDEELTEANAGASFFAHAGGAFDVQFILEEIVKDVRYQVTAHFSGASAVLVTVQRGELKWTFSDSFFLLPDSLAKVGDSIGVPKLKCGKCTPNDKKCTHLFDAPLEELIPYNARDCLILEKAVLGIQAELEELGGELRPTQASSGMFLFRRAYLKRKIPTSKALNDVLREGYCASRVEPFVPPHVVLPRGEYFDINSSFPYSMTFPLPGELKYIRRTIPDDGDAIWFARVTVTCPEVELPPLFFKRKGRIFFPTGTWTGIYSKVDLELLEKVGGTIEKVHEVWEFLPFTDLRDFILDLYGRRKVETARGLENVKARDEGKPEPWPGAEFRSYLYKKFMNCLYGKFAERTMKECLLVRPDSTSCPHRKKDKSKAHPNDECMTLVAPSIWRCKDEKRVPHAHVAISAYVTSLSRSWLWNHLNACKKRYYADTDSVVTGEDEKLPTGPELGQLKHEGTILDARFLAPKVYAFTDAKTGKRIVKSKGFRKLEDGEFLKLAAGDIVPIERLAGIRESLRDRSAFGAAWSKVTSKRLHRDTFPKRAPDGDTTRPWTTAEILDEVG